jgi:hypothetical protein
MLVLTVDYVKQDLEGKEEIGYVLRLLEVVGDDAITAITAGCLSFSLTSIRFQISI